MDDVVMESIFDVKGLVLATVKSAEVGIVFGEEHFRLYGIDIRIDFEIVRRANGWRRRKTV